MSFFLEREPFVGFGGLYGAEKRSSIGERRPGKSVTGGGGRVNAATSGAARTSQRHAVVVTVVAAAAAAKIATCAVFRGDEIAIPAIRSDDDGAARGTVFIRTEFDDVLTTAETSLEITLADRREVVVVINAFAATKNDAFGIIATSATTSGTALAPAVRETRCQTAATNVR